MILQRLADYSGRLEAVPEMHQTTQVRWIADLDEDGNFEGFVKLEDARMMLPVRRKETEPKILADTAAYVLAAGGAETAVKKHAAFKALVEACMKETDEPATMAVLEFLEGTKPEMPEDMTASDNVVFRVNGVFVHELPSVQEFWRGYTVREDAIPGRCTVCGQQGMVEKILPGKVKGLTRIGGQSSGTAIVSAKNPATHHHSLEASLNFPICRSCGEKFNRALNTLISDEKSRVFIGPLVYLFWTREAEDASDFASFLMHPDPDRVRDLLLSPYSGVGKHVPSEDFYVLALTAAGGRAVVRDYLETTIGEVTDNLRRWFMAQGEKEPLGIFPLAASCYHDPKDMQPRILVSLLEAAIKGRGLGDELLVKAVGRCRAEGGVTRPRAALMRLVLQRGEKEMEGSVAYHCGRLLAELEGAQKAAIPGAETTLTDRYYGAASSTPATVFGLLLRNTQPHLDKLKRDEPKAAAAIEGRIMEITTEIGSDLPKTLPMSEQARFALGYYNQKAHNRAAAREAWEKKHSNNHEKEAV